MVKLRNASGVKLFEDFIKQYQQCVNQAFNTTHVNEVCFIDSRHKLSSVILFNEDYFATNKEVGNIIAYNEVNCNNLQLTTQERYAMLAHELGHIYCNNNGGKLGSKFRREVYADSMADKLGLKAQLINGLSRIVMHNHVNNEIKQMLRWRIYLLQKN